MSSASVSKLEVTVRRDDDAYTTRRAIEAVSRHVDTSLREYIREALRHGDTAVISVSVSGKVEE